MEPVLISIEGTIGAGKSRLLDQLAGEFKVQKEPVDQDPLWEDGLLKKFYNDPRRYAYQFQTKILDSFAIPQIQRTLLVERSIFSVTRVFAHTLATKYHYLGQAELRGLKEKANAILNKSEPIQAIIYLQVPTADSYARIQQRAREGEELINLEYAHLLRKRYDEVFVRTRGKIPVYILDGLADDDYLKQQAEKIIREVESKPRLPRYHWPEAGAPLFSIAGGGSIPPSYILDNAIPPTSENGRASALYSNQCQTILGNGKTELTSGVQFKAPCDTNVQAKLEPVLFPDQPTIIDIRAGETAWLNIQVENLSPKIEIRRGEILAEVTFKAIDL